MKGEIDLSTILVADDEMMIRRLVEDFLKKEGHRVLQASDGTRAFDVICKKGPTIDLAILDVMMPGMDGFEILEQVRQSGAAYDKMPIILLTARNEVDDEVRGLNSGAQDYISKPFSPSVLCARVNALLKREQRYHTHIIEIGSIFINELRREVRLAGELLELTPKEYELLVFFINNKGIALSREALLNAVWGYDHFGDLRTVDTHVKKLRSKLAEHGDMIETVRGFGYRFEEYPSEKNIH